jgi:hypothetical protein
MIDRIEPLPLPSLAFSSGFVVSVLAGKAAGKRHNSAPTAAKVWPRDRGQPRLHWQDMGNNNIRFCVAITLRASTQLEVSRKATLFGARPAQREWSEGGQQMTHNKTRDHPPTQKSFAQSFLL